MPIADVGAWQEFTEEFSTGEGADAHGAFLRRGGVQTEHVFRQQTTMGDLIMAALRNLVIGVLSRAGPVNVAAALRRHARDPHRPLATLGISLG